MGKDNKKYDDDSSSSECDDCLLANGLVVEKNVIAYVVSGATVNPDPSIITYEIILTNNSDTTYTDINIQDTIPVLLNVVIPGGMGNMTYTVDIIASPNLKVASDDDIAQGKLLDSCNSKLPPCSVSGVLIVITLYAFPLNNNIAMFKNTAVVSGNIKRHCSKKAFMPILVHSEAVNINTHN